MNRWPVALGAVILLVQVGLGAILFAVFQQFVPVEMGAGDAWGGYMLGAYGFARFVSETPTGAISDRVERKLGLLIGFAVMVPPVLLMALIQDEWAYLAFAGMLGVGSAFLWPATYAIAADLYPPEERGQVVGMLNVGQFLGFGIGALAGALLIEKFPPIVFAVAIAGIVGATIAAALTIPSYRSGGVFKRVVRENVPPVRSILSRDVVYVSATVLATSMSLAAVVPLIRPFADSELHVSFASLTIALIPGILLGGLLYIPAGAMADRSGRTLPILLGQSAVAVGLIATSLTTNIWAAAMVAPLVFLGNVLTVPAINASVMDLAPATHRGTLIGLNVALSGLGLALGPVIGGILLETGSAEIGLQVAGAGAAVIAFAVFVQRSSFEHREFARYEPTTQ